MKNVFLIGLLGSIAIAANGQIEQSPANLTFSKNPGVTRSSHFITRVKPAVLRNFERSYGHVSNETWFELENGFAAKFNVNNIDYLVAYDKKGVWLHTIKTYGESELLPNIRHIVKSSYYDYNISFVQEIEKPRDTFTYIVHLAGNTKLINLRIYNGEMEEWQRFEKSD